MKRRKIINIRNIVLTGALFVSTVVAGLTNASASEIKNVNPTTDGISQTVMNNAELQRLGGGLIIDPTRLMPEGVINYGQGLPKWVAVNDVFEEGFKEDGTSIGMRAHIYNVTNVEVEANDNQTHTKHITAECKSCGHVWEYDKTQKCDFDEGVIKGNKIIYTCETEGCGNSYSKSNGHSNIGGGGSHGGGSNDNKPTHQHSYGEWKSLNDELEYAECNSCGNRLTREHKYNTPVISIKTNNDGTHTIVTNETCLNCNHSKTKTETKNCNYKTTNKYEAASDKTHTHTITDTCNECNHSKVVSSKEENCNFELTNSKTESNGDVTETYTCKATGCGNSYTKTIPYKPGHTHNYVSISTSIVSNNNGTHNEIETKKCSCGDVITNTISGNIACTFGPETIIGNQYVSACTSCGYEKTRPYVPEHKHTYEEAGTRISSKGNGTHDIYKIEKCSDPDCGHEIETLYLEGVNCTYGAGVPNEDNTLMTYTCNGCGHTKTEEIKQEHTHDYIISTRTVSNNDGTHDVIETKICDCGDVITNTISGNIACTFGPETIIGNQYVSACTSCGYEKTRPYVPEHKHTYEEAGTRISSKGNGTHDIYKIEKCSDPDCGHEIETLYLEGVNCTYGAGVPNEDNTLMTYTCNGCGHTKTEEIKQEHTHDYIISTRTVSNNDGTHDVIETKICDCGDKITTTISSGVACTESSQEEIKNDAGETIQIVYKCSCGYTVRTQNVDPKPVEHIHTPDSGSPHIRKPGNNCCYEEYYICSDPDCGQEYGTKSFGHIEGTPDKVGNVKCTECGAFIKKVEVEEDDELKPKSSDKLSNPTLQEEILNNDTFVEVEIVTPETNSNGEDIKTETESNVTVTPEVEETHVEDTITIPAEEPKQPETSEVEQIIENGNKEVEQVIEAGRQEAADVIEEGRKEVEEIIKNLDTDLQERLAESDARIASLLASNPLKRIRRLF